MDNYVCRLCVQRHRMQGNGKNVSMNIDLQKPNIWKRISAWMFDMLILVMLVVGIGFVLSAVTGYNEFNDTLQNAYDKYESEYEIEFEITGEEYLAMTEEEKATYDAAYDALIKDEAAMYAYNMVLNLTMMIITGSILIGYLILELFVPLKLGNGQTIGKKVFGIGVMRVDSVQLTTIQLFIRTILGKFTLETMIPVYIVLMIFFNIIGIEGTIFMGVFLIVQIVILCVTRTRSGIHDLLAGTVTVDIASQKIFKDQEALLEYIKNQHKMGVK